MPGRTEAAHKAWTRAVQLVEDVYRFLPQIEAGEQEFESMLGYINKCDLNVPQADLERLVDFVDAGRRDLQVPMVNKAITGLDELIRDALHVFVKEWFYTFFSDPWNETQFLFAKQNFFEPYLAHAGQNGLVEQVEKLKELRGRIVAIEAQGLQERKKAVKEVDTTMAPFWASSNGDSGKRNGKGNSNGRQYGGNAHIGRSGKHRQHPRQSEALWN